MIAALILAAAVTASAPAADPSTPVEGVDVTAPKKDFVYKQDNRAVAVAQKKLKSQPDAVICKSQLTPGSRLPSPPVCKTNIEWDRYRAEKRRDLERALSVQVMRR